MILVTGASGHLGADHRHERRAADRGGSERRAGRADGTAAGRRVGPFRRAQFRMEGRLKRSNEEHGAVVRAILTGDAAGAHAAMLHHVSLVEDAYEAFSLGTHHSSEAS